MPLVEAPKVSAVWALPIVLTLLFGAFLALPAIRQNPSLVASFWGTTAVMVAWAAALLIVSLTQGRLLAIQISLRPQHYLQALAHTSIFVYWGFYWDPLRHAAALIAAQIVFAYLFDMLLSWSRRGTYTLGFGPFPIIYSTNLFLRFHDDWFYLQFVMVAVGFLAKEFFRWDRDGRRTHIFNPSSFPLALFSLGLIVTHTTHLTWGEDIASLLILPPQIYLFIFAVSLPGQFLFRVTTMTLPAILTTYGFSMLYLKLTGTYFFWDSNIPIAVFLGMHLLFTDPSTSPRTELGRIIFGVMYGASVVGLYALLGWLGLPTFYDKLLQVPLMNLLVRRIDRVALSTSLAWLNPERLGRGLALRTRSAAFVTLWIAVFTAMTFAKGIGDFHPGHTITFWQNACDQGRRNACGSLAALASNHCRDGSPWACNNVAILLATKKVESTADPAALFQAACGAGLRAGCSNAAEIAAGRQTFVLGDPAYADFVLLLRQGKGPINEKTPFAVFSRACSEGWISGCGALAGLYFTGGDGVASDRLRAAALASQACEGGHARSCSNLGLMYKNGEGVPQDATKALEYLRRACRLGLSDACRWLVAEQAK